ncbi:lipase family protein [Rhodococcus tibetensis]|uniref:Lipase family protein n=1 Tax=Rhodococcus tibetensis TaxID=2965064 RepID=A0ABT1QK81_9NOCA|nr:lipase family protein [Rhodococcus sp. FXJ9.536]MCQ4122699.1 lipase family protein [Rhodococcus sp. FXJ9.536]
MSLNAEIAEHSLPESAVPDLAERSRPILPGDDPFYVAPAGFAASAPGSVLRSREVELALLGAIPQKVSAWQLLYRSCDLHRAPEVAVTTVLLPFGADPDEARPLLAYQCAIDAIADKCFPSYALQRGAFSPGSLPPLEMLIIANALERGWAVSLADHEGMGGFFGAPREPGYRVLDGIRAALRFAPLGLDASTPVGVWGYSGGGMASSWVVEMAPEYAPDIHIVGAALGAPVGDPGETYIRLNGTLHAGLPALVVAGLRHIYPGLERVIRTHADDEGIRRLDKIETMSTVEAVARFARDDFDDYTDIPLADVLATPEVLEVFEDIRLGGRIPECPLLVVHPVHDQIIDIDDVDGQVERYVEGGAHVTYVRDRLSEHLSLMVISAPAMLEWLTDRFAGRPLPAAGTTTVWSIACSALSPLHGLLTVGRTAAKVLFARPLGPN